MNMHHTLIQARVHLGHHKSLTHPLMKKYIYGRRREKEIIDLRHTLFGLQLAVEVIEEVLRNGGSVLFHVESEGLLQLMDKLTPDHPQLLIQKGSWMGGLLTNWDQLQSYARSVQGSAWDQLPPAKQKRVRKKFAPFLKLKKEQKYYILRISIQLLDINALKFQQSNTKMSIK